MSAQANSGFKHEIWQLINLDHSLIACGGFKKKTFLCELSTHESVRLILLHQLKHCSGQLPRAGSAHAALLMLLCSGWHELLLSPLDLALCLCASPQTQRAALLPNCVQTWSCRAAALQFPQGQYQECLFPGLGRGMLPAV